MGVHMSGYKSVDIICTASILRNIEKMKIRLGREFYNCPVWWKNFVIEVHEGWDGREEEAIERIHSALEPYRARTMRVDGVAFIEFDDEEMYTLFVMRWL